MVIEINNTYLFKDKFNVKIIRQLKGIENTFEAKKPDGFNIIVTDEFLKEIEKPVEVIDIKTNLPKRGRGRPKKIKKLAENELNITKEGSELIKTLVKRGRGRPRKVK